MKVQVNLCVLGDFLCFILPSANIFQNKLFQKILSGVPSACQTVCKDYQQTTLIGKELRRGLAEKKKKVFKLVQNLPG